MSWIKRLGVGLGAAALVAGVMPAYAGTSQTGVVSEDPVDTVPIVLDGNGVWGVATVGDITVAGGTFSSVRQRGAAAPVTRNNIFAFNSAGTISNTFRPNIPSRVWDVVPAGDGQSVFVGGQFPNVNGVARTNRVARINVNTGQVMTTFRSPGFDDIVTDLHLANGRLYVGGYFKNVAGQPHTGLVALNPDTGADTGHLNLPLAGVFNDPATRGTTASIPSGYRGVGVERFAMTPDGSRLIAIGNFRTVAGQSRVQVAMLNTTGATATLADWSTTRFSGTCSGRFPTYTMGIDTSPDGSYFAITTGGAFNGGATSGTLCDSTTRWETSASGPGQNPTWVDYMGGDSGTAVHVTGSAVYVGGHFRWVNNPYAADQPGPGFVRRSGLAALDPRNGVPFSFKADKLSLNWGVMRFASTSDGLWVAHDGDRINGETTGRLGLLPVTGGTLAPPDDTGTLPGDAYLLGKRHQNTGPNPILYRVNAGGPTLPAPDGWMDWTADQSTISSLRSTGSNASTWTAPVTRSASVPADTPIELFNTERWDPSTFPPMQWNFPVSTGVPLQVRLYFSNGYTGTANPGQRVFDVNVEGATVLDNYDIAADVGHATGTMKAFDISAASNDGNVDIDFSHVVENPLVSGIEIVRTDVPPPADNSHDDVSLTSLTETSAGGRTSVANGGVDWSSSRGAFVVDGRLYSGWSDGTFTWRPFNGTTFGTARSIDLHDLTAFATELTSIRAMWFDRVNGRLYYTLEGQNQLYYRYFTPQSVVVGGQRFTASTAGSGIDWSMVRGGFLANGKLFFSNADGTLRSTGWASGSVTGTAQTISGPGIDSLDWSSGSLLLRVQ